MTKQLAPIEELALATGLILKTTNLELCPSYLNKLEQLRQAIIRDFVSTLEPVAWTYTKRNGEPTVTLDFNFATIVIGDGFDVTRLFNLSEWSK